jgi:hypothetical protein
MRLLQENLKEYGVRPDTKYFRKEPVIIREEELERALKFSKAVKLKC